MLIKKCFYFKAYVTITAVVANKVFRTVCSIFLILAKGHVHNVE